MKRTFTCAFLFATVACGSMLTSCQKDVDLAPYEKQIEDGKKSLATLTETHNKALADLKAAQDRVTALEALQTQLNARVQELTASVAATTDEVAKKEQELLLEKAQLEQTKTQLETAIARAEEAEAKKEELESRIAVLEKAQSDLQAGSADAQAEASQTIQDLNAKIATLEADKQKEADAHSTTKSTLEEVRTQLANAQVELEALKTQLNDLNRDKIATEQKIEELTAQLAAKQTELNEALGATRVLKLELASRANEAEAVLSILEKQATIAQSYTDYKRSEYNHALFAGAKAVELVDKKAEQIKANRNETNAAVVDRLNALNAQLTDALKPSQDLRATATAKAQAVTSAEGALATVVGIRDANLPRLQAEMRAGEEAKNTMANLMAQKADFEAQGNAVRAQEIQTAIDAYRPLHDATIQLGRFAGLQYGANNRDVFNADSVLGKAHEEAEAAERAAEAAENAVQSEKARLEGLIDAVEAEIRSVDSEYADLVEQYTTLSDNLEEERAKFAKAKQAWEDAKSNHQTLKDSIAKLKETIAKLKELAK